MNVRYVEIVGHNCLAPLWYLQFSHNKATHRPSLSRIHPVTLGSPMHRRMMSNMNNTPITPNISFLHVNYTKNGGRTCPLKAICFHSPLSHKAWVEADSQSISLFSTCLSGLYPLSVTSVVWSWWYNRGFGTNIDFVPEQFKYFQVESSHDVMPHCLKYIHIYHNIVKNRKAHVSDRHIRIKVTLKSELNHLGCQCAHLESICWH